MDTDKAYILGLIVGGGYFGNAEDNFKIYFPFKEWGSYKTNPERAASISQDIHRKVGQILRAIYGLTAQFETTPGGLWTLLCEGDASELRNDLQQYGIACDGRVWDKVEFDRIIPHLIDDNLKRRFVAGLADTIGSIAKSHRKFTKDCQILSFEIRGTNFKSVCALCHLLYDINCIPDQVNWNHPNIHCSKDPYYRQWSKGFKLRVLLDQYAQFGAFAFRTKAESSQANRALQNQENEATRCEERSIRCSPSCVHPAENSPRLPTEIRGGHYIHFSHICAAMQCEHAPYNKLLEKFSEVGTLINPFPILSKGSKDEIDAIIRSNALYNNRTYRFESANISHLLDIFKTNPNTLLYPNKPGTGYPVDLILQATSYIIANQDELAGKRCRNSYIGIIEAHIRQGIICSVSFRIPDLLTPLIIEGNERAALVGPNNRSVYEKLVSFDPNNRYKLFVRPITEEDLA